MEAVSFEALIRALEECLHAVVAGRTWYRFESPHLTADSLTVVHKCGALEGASSMEAITLETLVGALEHSVELVPCGRVRGEGGDYRQNGEGGGGQCENSNVHHDLVE